MPSADIRIATLREILQVHGVNAIVDRVYPRFGLHSQATGRWSTTDPPLPQVPSNLHHLYLADPEWPGFGWDWDQLHMRLAVGYTGDRKWQEAFDNGFDIHTDSACDLFALPTPPDRGDPHKAASCADWRARMSWQGKEDSRRGFAKRYIYRLLKGGDPYKEPTSIPGVEALGLKKAELRLLGIQWARQHPETIRWLESLRKQVREKGVVRDFMGRRRAFSERSKHSERAGCDYPTQAGEVEILNETILAVTRELGDKVRFMYQRHDFIMWGVHRMWYNEDTFKILASIAARNWTIMGRTVFIPATFYTLSSEGKKIEWKPKSSS
jgi:DNA polymerase I